MYMFVGLWMGMWICVLVFIDVIGVGDYGVRVIVICE